MIDVVFYYNSVNGIALLITISAYGVVILARHSVRPFIFIILFNSQINPAK